MFLSSVFLRTILLYVIVLVLIRLMGKREVGQLSAFDLVVAIMIAEVAVIPMEQVNIPFYYALIPLFTLVAAEMLFSYICLKSEWLRKAIDGSPSIVIARGRIREEEMRRLRYNINDLLSQLRTKNVFDPAEVEYAILETSGELSVLLRSELQPLTPAVLDIPAKPVNLSVPLIADGRINRNRLAELGQDEDWLRRELLEREGLSLDDIFFASYHPHRGFYVSMREKKT